MVSLKKANRDSNFMVDARRDAVRTTLTRDKAARSRTPPLTTAAAQGRVRQGQGAQYTTAERSLRAGAAATRDPTMRAVHVVAQVARAAVRQRAASRDPGARSTSSNSREALARDRRSQEIGRGASSLEGEEGGSTACERLAPRLPGRSRQEPQGHRGRHGAVARALWHSDHDRHRSPT